MKQHTETQPLDSAAGPQRARARSEETAGERTHLEQYFGQLAKLPLMTADEEVEAAQRVLEAEVQYWEALLSHVTVFDSLHECLRSLVQAPPDAITRLAHLARTPSAERVAPSPDEAWNRLARSVAEQLRQLDTDRHWVRTADATVHALEGDATREFRRYLERVDRARRKQDRAKHRFVAANLRLVVSVARRYNRGHLPLIDLIQEGNIGLMKAVERFDHTRGFRFSTYASWWIRHAITRAAADKGRVVRIPVRVLDARSQVSRAAQRFSVRMGRTPSSEELSEETGIAADKLEDIRGLEAATTLSLDRPVSDADGQSFVDLLEADAQSSPYDDVEARDWSNELCRLLQTLTPTEAAVLRLRFGLDAGDELTLKTIGDRLQLSRERIRQIQNQALGKMRRQMSD